MAHCHAFLGFGNLWTLNPRILVGSCTVKKMCAIQIVMDNLYHVMQTWTISGVLLAARVTVFELIEFLDTTLLPHFCSWLLYGSVVFPDATEM